MRRLTIWQISEIFQHERDDKGKLIVDYAPSGSLDAMVEEWKSWGLTDDEIKHKRHEFWVIEGRRDELEKQKLSPEEIEKRLRDYRVELTRKRTWRR